MQVKAVAAKVLGNSVAEVAARKVAASLIEDEQRSPIRLKQKSRRTWWSDHQSRLGS